MKRRKERIKKKKKKKSEKKDQRRRFRVTGKRKTATAKHVREWTCPDTIIESLKPIKIFFSILFLATTTHLRLDVRKTRIKNL